MLGIYVCNRVRERVSKLSEELETTFLEGGFVVDDLQFDLSMQEDEQSCDPLHVLNSSVRKYLLPQVVAALQIDVTFLVVFFF